MKKILCLLMALLMMFAVLVACGKTDAGIGSDTSADSVGSDGPTGDSGTTDTDKPTNDNGEVDDKPSFIIEGETLDFQGLSVGIACRPETRYIREFAVETQADPVDLKIFKRNKAIENEIKVEIQTIPTDKMWTYDGIQSFVMQESQAGAESDTDIVAAYGAYSTTPMLRGFYVNLFDETQVSYINTENAYWNQGYVKAATTYNQLYYIVGDVNLTIYDKSIAVFTNMDLATENDIDPQSLYEAVKSGEWTYDYMYQVVQNFSYLDSDEDGNVNVGDVVPLASIAGSESNDPFLSAWKLDLLVTNDDGSHSVVIDGNAKLESACSKLTSLYDLTGVFLTTIEKSFDQSFVKGKALFDIDIIYRNADSNTNLRNCGFDYAILPLPKYDIDQDGYYTTPQDAYNTMSIMNHHEDKIEATCATLEYMSYKSYNDVRPFYIEKMVKATYITGADKVIMLDTAMQGTTFDTFTIYAAQLVGGTTTIWRAATADKITIAERWAKKRDAIITAVEDFDIWFAMMDPYAGA